VIYSAQMGEATSRHSGAGTPLSVWTVADGKAVRWEAVADPEEALADGHVAERRFTSTAPRLRPPDELLTVFKR
jgi:hypothetical protein